MFQYKGKLVLFINSALVEIVGGKGLKYTSTAVVFLGGEVPHNAFACICKERILLVVHASLRVLLGKEKVALTRVVSSLGETGATVGVIVVVTVSVFFLQVNE